MEHEKIDRETHTEESQTQSSATDSMKSPKEENLSRAETEDNVEDNEEFGPMPPNAKSEDLIKAAETKAQEMQDKYLRLNAEFENFKKRMAKENADKLKYYNLGLIKEILPAIDSLERAIEHSGRENINPTVLMEGVQMVFKMVQDTMEKFGVNKVKAVGEPFDPNCHQAVGMVESDTVPDNYVVDQFQSGYFLYDRIVRPSMVRVSKKS